MSIVIIDYGAGNLKNLKNACDFLNVPTKITDSLEEISQATKILFPGVGAFGYAMQNLRKKNLEKIIKEKVAQGIPFFGICLGMQLLFTESEESPNVAGLDLVPGKVELFKISQKVPHMGWNTLEPQAESILTHGLQANSYAYFVHSFYCSPTDPSNVISTTNYEIDFASMVQKDNVYGAQFHPEKSQDVGLRILKNFLEL